MKRFSWVVIAFITLVFGASCEWLKDIHIDLPRPRPTATSTTTPQTPEPTKEPTSTPSATVVPTVAPTRLPSAAPQPVGDQPWPSACKLPLPPIDPLAVCNKTTPGEVGLWREVAWKAMENVQQRYPYLLHYKGASGCAYVVEGKEDQDAYYYNVMLEIHVLDSSVCTFFEGDQINVYRDLTYNESFHALRGAAFCVPDKYGIYVWNCKPASR